MTLVTRPIGEIFPSGDTSGATDIAAINASLTANGITVVRDGTFLINAAIQQPSNTLLVLQNAVVRLTAGANCNVWRNKNQTTVGDRNVYIVGRGRALFDGNASNQSLVGGLTGCINNLGMSAVTVDQLHVRNIQIGPTRFWTAFLQGVTNSTWRDINLEQDRSQLIYQDGIDIGPGCSQVSLSRIRGKAGDDICAIQARIHVSVTNGPHPTHSIYGTTGNGLPLDVTDIFLEDYAVAGPYSLVRIFNDSLCNVKRIRGTNLRNTDPTSNASLFAVGSPVTWTESGYYPAVGSVSGVSFDGLSGYCAQPIGLDGHIDYLRVRNLDPESTTGVLVGTRENNYTPTIRNIDIDATSRPTATAATDVTSYQSGTTVTSAAYRMPAKLT